MEQKKLSTFIFILFFGWLLSFPFEGRVLSELAIEAKLTGNLHVFFSILAHGLGLATSGIFVKEKGPTKRSLKIILVLCILGSLVFYLPFSGLWYLSLGLISLLAGFFVGWLGFYFKKFSSPQERLQLAADVLIYSNILMLLNNVLTEYTSPLLGLSMAIGFLVVAFLLLPRLESCKWEQGSLHQERGNIASPLFFLCLFILIITINSGFMYQVVTPSFAHLRFLTSFYWALPYIGAILIMRYLPIKTNRAYLFYVALIMNGVSFLLFMFFDRSASSYLLIDTLMLGAFGICDLFWWTILGSFLDYTTNPAQVLGMGLSMNVLGVLVGAVAGDWAILAGGRAIVPLISLVVIFGTIIIVPLLNSKLAAYLKEHVFLVKFGEHPSCSLEQALQDFKSQKQLTNKEAEVIRWLLAGYTYKAIAEALLISENTLRYHIKNIYQKLNINSKMELIKMFASDI